MGLLEEFRAVCPGIRAGEPLVKHSSLGVGGPAEIYADVNTREELIALRKEVNKTPVSVFLIGAGSNLLISDQGIPGLVIHLQGDLRKATFEDDLVHVAAGAWLPSLAKQCAEKGLAGLEPLVGVPGSVGGGLVMNAGTRDGELGALVESVDVVESDGSVRKMPKSDLRFTYRHSNLEGFWILGATLRLKRENAASIMARIDSYLQYRSRTQPLATSNCGSVFKNPPNGFAAKMIEECGLKGRAIGGARISEKHANFIINENKAKAMDVYELICLARREVDQKFHIKLEPEVKLIGEFPRKEELFH